MSDDKLEVGYAKKAKEYDIRQIMMGDVPFPLNLLETFAAQEYSEENIGFFREAETYKEEPELGKRDEIVDTYIREEAEKQVNIGAESREEILERQKKEEDPRDDLFVQAQEDVFDLVKRDTFPRFRKKIMETNLNFKTADEATQLGVVLLVIAIILTAVTFTLQALCDPANPTVPEFCASIEILGNRFWRLLAAPFYMGAIMFILAGREKFCPICAGAGANFQFSDPKRPYWKIIVSKVMGEYVVRAPEILAANRRKARRSVAITVVSSMMLAIIVVLVPPDNPRWYS